MSTERGLSPEAEQHREELLAELAALLYVSPSMRKRLQDLADWGHNEAEQWREMARRARESDRVRGESTGVDLRHDVRALGYAEMAGKIESLLREADDA